MSRIDPRPTRRAILLAAFGSFEACLDRLRSGATRFTAVIGAELERLFLWCSFTPISGAA